MTNTTRNSPTEKALQANLKRTRIKQDRLMADLKRYFGNEQFTPAEALAEMPDIGRQNMSKQLSRLAELGRLKSQRSGRTRAYQIK